MRPAAQIVKEASGCRSSIWLRACGKAADARNILSIVLLAAAAGSTLELEVSGEDETEALARIESVFANGAAAEPR